MPYLESYSTIPIEFSVLRLYASGLPGRDIAPDLMVLIFGKPILVERVKKGGSKQVLEIDVERPWKALGEDAGWSNEVSLEIFIHYSV